MDASGISSVNSQKKCRGIRTALASAVLEWFLMCLLFIEAIFSYLITKFARYCELQMPCLLCSRLDHILSKIKLESYCDFFCGNHKLEISSLVICHAHNKLADVHGMCESCLFSFATINKSNAETYRLLVGKLGEGSRFGLNEDPLLEDHTSSTQHCSCCNEPWIPRGYGQNLMQTNIVGSETTEFDAPLSGAAAYDLDNLNEIERSIPARSTHQRSISEFDHLPHIGYTELKVNSDTESEVMFSDDDHNENARSRAINTNEDIVVGCGQTKPRIIDSVAALQTPISASPIQSDFVEFHDVTSISATVSMGNSLEELHWQQANGNSDFSAVPELILLDEIPPSSTAKETPIEASKESKISSFNDVPSVLDVKEIIEEASKESIFVSVENVLPSSVARETPVEASELTKHISVYDIFPSSDSKEPPTLISTESKLVSLVDVLPSSSGVETPIQGLQENCIARTEEIWQTAGTECEEISKTGTSSAAMNETALETNPVSGDNGLQALNFLDLGDAYKLAVGSKGRQLSGVLAEQWIGKDSSRLSDDLKILFSQLSLAREHTMNDSSPRLAVSPKLSIGGDELKNLDASSSIGMQLLQKRISLERNESGLSLDGSIVSEIEGESAVDRLKRQIEHDKQLLSALYKELDEERNSSAISANQAMAMITRLQEEKATLQMEALQYLRMMEEQAEYDMEALQKTNDLLSEREKEIQDLEAELEFYRNNRSESLREDTLQQLSDTKTKDIKEEHPDATSVSTSPLRNSDAEKPDNCQEVEGSNSSGDTNEGTVKNSLLDFDNERAYIQQCLKRLEKRLCQFTNNQTDLINGEYSGKIEDRVNGLKELNSKLGFQVNRGADEKDDLSTQKDRGNSPVQGQALSLEKSELISNEYNEMFYSGQGSPLPAGGIDLDNLSKEVSELNERLKTIEADRNFLELSINSIRNGEEGLQLIQEIASYLKELRSIATRGREQSVA